MLSHWDNPRVKDYADTLERAVARRQFRFKDIVDLSTGEVILELEHELRAGLQTALGADTTIPQHIGCPLGRSREVAEAAALFLGTEEPVYTK